MLRTATKICVTVLLALLLSAPTLSTPSTAAVTVTTAAAGQPEAYRLPATFDQQVLYWTNVARRQHHRKPLRMMTCLDNYATNWTQRMASIDSLRHQSMWGMLRACNRTLGRREHRPRHLPLAPPGGGPVDALPGSPQEPAEPPVPLHRHRGLALDRQQLGLRHPGLRPLTHQYRSNN